VVGGRSRKLTRVVKQHHAADHRPSITDHRTPTTDAMLTLAEALVLLMHDGRRPIVPSFGREASLAVAGALLAELALLGRISLEGPAVTVERPDAVGDALLDPTLRLVTCSAPRRAAALWVDQVCYELGDVQRRVLARLAGRGVLRYEERRLLRLVRHPRFLVADTETVERIHDGARAAGLGLTAPDRHTIVLLGLLGACHRLPGLFSAHALGGVRERARDLVRRDPVAATVSAAVADADYTSVVASLSIFVTFD
jgi:golgi phosphoprotein 3